jgi:hypothetical protein
LERETIPGIKRKRHRDDGAFFSNWLKPYLDGFLSQPVCDIEIRFNLSSLVAVFQRFFGLIISFSEGMFGVPHCFIDDFQCSGHGSIPFARINLA